MSLCTETFLITNSIQPFSYRKKDQCQTCVSYQNSSEEEKNKLENEYAIHLEEMRLSREEKERDKRKINQFYHVACFDLQDTLATPGGEVSSFYYTSKLSTYNFTVCGLLSKGQRTCKLLHVA
jgi:hypothetical protein